MIRSFKGHHGHSNDLVNAFGIGQNVNGNQSLIYIKYGIEARLRIRNDFNIGDLFNGNNCHRTISLAKLFCPRPKIN
jgi:hypothetical protein